MEIWQWTLTKDAVAPCFVRDVLDMLPSNADGDFFWLGYTPCRTVLLVGMVVAVQVYDKRTIYTIDDGTAVIDCVLRHPHPIVTAPPSPPRAKSNAQPLSPKKQHPDKIESIELPPPITEPGYPVRVVGRVVRHHQSKQVHANSIDPCPSSLDEIAHLERVIQLHKTKYSLAVPFVPPPKPTSRAAPPDASTSHAASADESVFSAPSHAAPRTATSYTLPMPPRMPMPPQNRNKPPLVPIYNHTAYHGHTHVPSSPASSSVASSTPSSPCKPSSPVKSLEAPSKPKLRHPSRLHTHDLTANTFRLYVKHYMDNAPPPFSIPSWPSPSRSTCENMTTPTRRRRSRVDESEGGEATPRPFPRHCATASEETALDGTETDDDDVDRSTLGFTLSHLRRVPELALLAARVVRAETRKRDKAEREKTKTQGASHTCATPTSAATTTTDPTRKKMKRLFSWAVVKLYEEGSIVLWDGEVRPLPLPPPLPCEVGASAGAEMWHDGTLESIDPSASTRGSAWTLYNTSVSASLYSHYHAPRRRDGGHELSVSAPGTDADADPAEVSDPGMDEEAYVPLNPRFLARYVREAVGELQRRRRGRGIRAGAGGQVVSAEEVLACMQRLDGRWARVGVWAVEEALAILR